MAIKSSVIEPNPALETIISNHWFRELQSIVVDPLKILRIHGYKDFEKVRPIIKETAIEFAKKAENLMTPIAHACRINVTRYEEKRLVLETGTVFQDIDFEQLLNGAQSVVVMVLTVGKELDNVVIDAIDKFEPLEALFLETAGWLGIEAATKNFVQELQASIGKEGKRVTRRIGPGYSYNLDNHQMHWPLEQQRDLFGIFNGTSLPVKLLESCAMLPKMSRSGLYGIASLN